MYPEQCRTPDGRMFPNPSQRIENPDPRVIAGGEQGGGCVLAGCSQTICTDAGEAAQIVTTCEYRAEYACYQGVKCERQSDGKCGWTQTPALKQCLAHPPALEASAEAAQ
jgi:hypothetical protein